MSLNSSGSGSNGGGSGSGGNSGSPCGACKFLRRKCVSGCIFAPYFDSEHGTTHFAAVHKVFGASNVSKLLLGIPINRRLDAAVSLCYEAQARLRDPIYGCVGHIFALQQQVLSLQAELSYMQSHINSSELTQPPLPPPQAAVAPAVFSFADLPPPTATTMPVTYDMSTLFDPMGQPSLAMQHQRPNIDPRQYLPARGPTSTTSSHRQIGSSSAPSSNASSSPSFSKFSK
ncbi:LOB domain-containing protein 18-like [Trifolium pratense]|uniref:LOB domain-containing protein 18-like n=1 Tax=Trifolium pratense TaxID=57577 RepID=UPI001E6907F4|nr:LOB domain-containing protein 18-like [Trifolium pratense]